MFTGEGGQGVGRGCRGTRTGRYTTNPDWGFRRSKIVTGSRSPPSSPILIPKVALTPLPFATKDAEEIPGTTPGGVWEGGPTGVFGREGQVPLDVNVC